MKKKAIEKIPYFTLKNISRKKDVKYIGVTGIKVISHEKHLFLEVYKNSKETKKIPVARIVLTNKDFGTYFPKTGNWSQKRVEEQTYSYRDKMIWNSDETAPDKTKKENILQSDEDLERIKNFCKVEIWRAERWWEYIEKYQNNISTNARIKREERKLERRQQALRERITHTRKLPEKEILDRADELYFKHKHYLYYKKHGGFVQIACSKCGKVADARWKDGISYESQFERRVINEPREGTIGKCPMCRTYGKYKCQGKTKGTHSSIKHLFLGQKYKETGIVLRYIEIEKTWRLEKGSVCDKKGPKMESASENVSMVELARAYFEPGKKPQIDYHKYNSWIGNTYWDDCNLSGLANIIIKGAPVMEETYKELEDTIFQYCALEQYVNEKYIVNPVDYLSLYEQMPQIEMLVKFRLSQIVTQLLEGNYSMIVNRSAKSLDKFLGIRKCRVKQLIAQKGKRKILRAMQMETSLHQMWTDEQIEHLAETGLEQGRVEEILPYMSLQKLLNRIEKYAGCKYETECEHVSERIRHIATTYSDYLSMRLRLGYDLSNTVYQYPHDLQQAHTEMVLEMNKDELDERIRDVKIRFGQIQRNYRQLRKKYFYEDDEYVIRPARSAEEIVMEGRLLHHCVGRDGYLRKHNDGRTYILLLRRKTDPESPYITVEIENNSNEILQWYGSCDKKPNEKKIQKWLDNYESKLNDGTISANNETVKHKEQTIMAIA